MPDFLTEVFLDLDPSTATSSDETAGDAMLGKLNTIIPNIGKRVKSLKKIGIAYDTPIVLPSAHFYLRGKNSSPFF